MLNLIYQYHLLIEKVSIVKMIKDQILRQLLTNTKAEEEYLKHPHSLSKAYEHIQQISFKGNRVYKFELPTLKQKNIQIRKDSRYTAVPPFIHTNINLNYILRGQCTYTVDKTKFVMHKGDVCLFDTDVLRQKDTLGTDDLVINISMSNAFFTGDFLNKLQTEGIIYGWLLSSLSATSSNHDNFILFRNHNNEEIEEAFEEIINEYYGQDKPSITIINSLLLIGFLQMIRQQNKNSDNLIRIHNNYLNTNKVNLVGYVNENMLNKSLKEMATDLGYSSVYLSELISKTFGVSLTKLRRIKKLNLFVQDLVYSDKSIDQIISDRNISNKSYLFKEFKKAYGTTPRKYRLKNSLF